MLAACLFAIHTVCPDVGIDDAVPAKNEWSYWGSAGASRVVSSWRPAFAIGAETTVGVLRYPGFPSGHYGSLHGDAELRAGPWIAAATRGDGSLVEGGLKLHLGAVYHASWGTFDLRLGGGYGRFDEQRTPHLSATLAYGVRSVRARYTHNGGCVGEHGLWGYTQTPAKPVAMAEVLRLFVTLRRATNDEHVREIVFGVEMSPTFFRPPNGWHRLAGGPVWY